MVRTIKLNNGYTIPIIGLGTWQLGKQETVDVIKTALDLGYRHIDTALVYENEREIGNALSDAPISRAGLFLTSKLWNSYHDNPEKGLEKSLGNLKTNYLDLYYIHWPVTFENKDGVSIWKNGNPVLKFFNLKNVYENMEGFVKNGKIRSIGVSNFGIKNISKILEFCEIKPAMLQIEYHPYLQQNELVEFCRENKIGVTAYSPLGSSKTGDCQKVLEDKLIQKIAKNLNVSPSTVILSWIASKEIVVIPRSKDKRHLKENLELIELSGSEIEAIDSISKVYRYVDPENFGPNRFM